MPDKRVDEKNALKLPSPGALELAHGVIPFGFENFCTRSKKGWGVEGIEKERRLRRRQTAHNLSFERVGAKGALVEDAPGT